MEDTKDYGSHRGTEVAEKDQGKYGVATMDVLFMATANAFVTISL